MGEGAAAAEFASLAKYERGAEHLLEIIGVVALLGRVVRELAGVAQRTPPLFVQLRAQRRAVASPWAPPISAIMVVMAADRHMSRLSHPEGVGTWLRLE